MKEGKVCSVSQTAMTTRATRSLRPHQMPTGTPIRMQSTTAAVTR